MNRETQRRLEGKAIELAVLRTANILINQAVPGKIWKCMHKDTEEISVPKAKIISDFKWIVEQTKGFTVPLMVNFRHGKAVPIGLFFATAVHPSLSNQLYALRKKGIQVPSFADGWHTGPISPYIMFSNRSRTKGIQGYSLDGVSVINIHGEAQLPEQVILLDDIPS